MTSQGQLLLETILTELIPNEPIVKEHHVGDRLRLDLYIPRWNLGIEYHGKQHFQFSTLFHETWDDFLDAQKRDIAKMEACHDQGIALVVFDYREKLTNDLVFERILDALNSTPHKPVEKVSKYKGNPYYEQRKEQNRQHQRIKYRELKKKRANGT